MWLIAMKKRVTPAMTHITNRVIMTVLVPMAMKKRVIPAMTHITIRIIMRVLLHMAMTHITIRVIMRVLLAMAMKKRVIPPMTHITIRVIIRAQATNVVGIVTNKQCFKSHVGSQQHIDIMHKNMCTETF
jgi:hypothetical protein